MMRRPLNVRNQFLCHSDGQAMVEYILMILVALSLVVMMGHIFRKTLIGVWGFYTHKISAACPTGCQFNPTYNFR